MGHRHSRCNVSLWALPALLVYVVAGIAQPPEADHPSTVQELIDGIKGFEKSAGLPQTRSFEQESDTIKSYYRCYYTGPLELPESYDGLELRQGSETGCGMDPRKYDVFFYALQAAGSGKTPLTSSLARSSVERILVVVPHEDYHARKALPTSIGEAVATLVGFVTAANYARGQFGAESRVYHNLSLEPELFLKKSAIVNRYYADLRKVYDRLQSRQITSPIAFAMKGRLFEQLRSECDAINPNPTSFNKSVSAYNNAGLAFDRTYTQYYPLIYELFESRGRDLKLTIDALDRALNEQKRSEQRAVAKIRSLIDCDRLR
jgi:hypothetical protein